MMRSVMEAAGLTFWPVLSLTVFGLYAVGLVFWLYRKGSREFYQSMAAMATEEGGHGRQG
jgi:hypothetical protein